MTIYNTASIANEIWQAHRGRPLEKPLTAAIINVIFTQGLPEALRRWLCRPCIPSITYNLAQGHGASEVTTPYPRLLHVSGKAI